ncbi:MAG: C1 family peptidase [Ezakiella sp.]|nr:C1 family peptidase [Ezakiella sp.]
MKQLSKDKIKSYEKKFLEDKKNIAAMNAATFNGINKVVVNQNRIGEVPFNFNLDLKEGEVTNQKKTGRCWMFASLNVMRNMIMKNLNLETFELSQSYPLFFDKLERSNYYLEAVIEKANDPIDDRTMVYLMDTLLGDGGQWDMFVNLVKKYGVVPKSVYPESNSSSATYEMNKYLCKILDKYTLILRDAVNSGKTSEEIGAIKEEALSNIYNVLTACLGELPESFDFIVHDKDDKLIEEKDITPLEFFEKYVKMDIDNYVSLINSPTKDKPFNETYTIEYLNNVVDGRLVKHLNLPIEELEKAAIKQLQDGIPVWFGCDVGKDSYRGENRAVLDTNIMEYDKLFGVDFDLSKEDALDYGYSQMTHAMTFTGVQLDENGNPIRWKVENSWGKDFGYEGYFTMSEEWFREYLYQVVVDKKYLPEELQKAYDKEPILLKPWDPMGSLA